MEETDILKKAGLNEAQAAIYYSLLKNGAMSPAELATETGQSRENCYAVAKKLVELGLIEQTDSKKARYRVLNPSSLEVLAEKRRKVMAKNEKLVKDNISALLDIFYANNEMPGARTLEGIEGLEEVYKDMLRVKKDVYYLRTDADEGFWHDTEEHYDFLEKYREQRSILGIRTYALTPATKRAVKHARAGSDNAWNFDRTWMPVGDYTAPAEMWAYGDKAAFCTYGETQISTLITSPAIAEAIRQVIKLLKNFYQKNFPQEQK
ncbi:winged helix-turn-helix transcriptional regulator [Candidatus Saccharibacteria bacterium]|nr:winged helix-turn-helix transcriptional regulator [Candidatus Saccharibacteria bacterium]